MKHFFFRFYWCLAFLSFAALAFLVIRDSQKIDWPIILSWVGSTLTFVYFVQKQKLEELTLLKDLFKDFNGRYGKLNEHLNGIIAADVNAQLSRNELDALDDYFNLCAEEYFYYRKGYIEPEIWKSWHNGMKVFFRNERIRKIWEQECKSESYYGFRPD